MATLLNLNINQEELSFLPYSGFTYRSTLSVENYTQPSRYDSSYNFSYNQTKLNITVINVNTEMYNEKDTLQDCLDDPKSWYQDFANQLLYVHFPNDIKPYDNIVSTLRSSNFGTELYIDALEQAYEPLLESRIDVKKKADRLKYNKMTFSRQKVKLNNGEADFDTFFTDPIPSSVATLSFLSDEAKENGDTPIDVYTGIVSADEISTESFKLNLDDIRALQTITIPRAFITSTDYTNIDDDVDGAVLATGYGTVRGIPGVCTNGKIKTGNVEYVFSDFSASISQVYVKNDEYWTPVSTVSASSGGFVLSAADARNDQNDPKPTKVDAVLRSQVNPADIIQDLNTRYLDIAFDSSEYDLTEWNSEKALLEDVGILLNKEQDIFKYIEELQGGSNYGFIYDILGNGKRTIRVDYANRTPVRTVQEIELLDKEKETERDFSEYAAEIKIDYLKDYSTNRYKYIIDNTYFDQAVELYTNAKRETFESLLTNSTDAEAKGAIIANEYKRVRPRYKIKVSDSWAYNIKLFDILNVEFGYQGQRVGFDSSGDPIYIHDRFFIGDQRCQVIGYKYKLDKNEVEFTLIQKEEVV
jgi:hypothetical protein